MRKKLLAVTAAAILITALAGPLPARAQTRYCADLDFRTETGGFVSGVDIFATWVDGEGWQTTNTGLYDLVNGSTIEFANTMRVDYVSIVFQINTWGGGSADQANLVYLSGGGGDQPMINELHSAPGTWGMSWSGTESVEGRLVFLLVASGNGGSGGLGYWRSMHICGSSLPAGWNPTEDTGTFEGVNPWATEEYYTRPTPTPWVVEITELPIGFEESDAAQVADVAINAYRFVNQQGALDTLIFFLMSGLILLLIFRFMKGAKKDG